MLMHQVLSQHQPALPGSRIFQPPKVALQRHAHAYGGCKPPTLNPITISLPPRNGADTQTPTQRPPRATSLSPSFAAHKPDLCLLRSINVGDVDIGRLVLAVLATEGTLSLPLPGALAGTDFLLVEQGLQDVLVRAKLDGREMAEQRVGRKVWKVQDAGVQGVGCRAKWQVIPFQPPGACSKNCRCRGEGPGSCLATERGRGGLKGPTYPGQTTHPLETKNCNWDTTGGII